MRLLSQSTRATIRTLTLLFAVTSLLLTMLTPFVGTAEADGHLSAWPDAPYNDKLPHDPAATVSTLTPSPGNKTCSQLDPEASGELKFDGNPKGFVGDTLTSEDGLLKVTLTAAYEEDFEGETWLFYDFEVHADSERLVSSAFSKQADTGAFFDYGATPSGGDHHLHSVEAFPDDISHVSFCYSPTEPNPVDVDPSGTLTTECGTWTTTVSVSDIGEHQTADNTPILFEVREGTDVLASVSLNAGESDTLAGSFGEDTGDHAITLAAIDANSTETTLDTATVETDCEPPVVEPVTLAVDLLAPTCDNDTPYLVYDVAVENTDSTTVTIHWFDANGVEQHTDVVEGLSGRVLWPGAEVDDEGNPTDWPGWIFEDDEWVQADDGFAWSRDGAQVSIEVNPTTDPVTVTYPPPTPTCDANPPEPEVLGEVFEQPQLPTTGLDTGRLAVWSLLITALGVLILVGTAPAAAPAGRRRD